MATRKSNVQVTLDSTSIAVLKALLHQVEQVKTKSTQRLQRQDSTLSISGQLPLLAGSDDN